VRLNCSTCDRLVWVDIFRKVKMMSELIVINKENALEVFTGERLDDFLKQIEDDAMNFIPDISTDKSRKQIASKAFSIAKEKTAIDLIGKELVADWTQRTALVNKSRKKSRDFLDDLKDRIRKPLTDFEDSEIERIAADNALKELTEAWEDAIGEDGLFDRQRALEIKEAKLLADEDARIEKQRIEEEKQAQIEHEKWIADEARIKAENEAKETIENAKREKIEAEIRAKQEAEKAERDKAEAVERAKKEEADRLAKIQYAKEANERLEKQLAEKKAANIQHQKTINNTVLADFVKAGIKEPEAKNIINLIGKCKIRYVSINY